MLGATDAGRALVAGIRARLAALAERDAGPARAAADGGVPRVDRSRVRDGQLGTGADRARRAAPARWATAGAHSTTLPWQALRDADPDVIVVAPCGFGLERTLAEMPTLAAQPGWGELRAVRAGRVYVADGNLYFNRSGPLLFDTPEILAEILHPAAFPPAHEGAVWRRWPVVA